MPAASPPRTGRALRSYGQPAGTASCLVSLHPAGAIPALHPLHEEEPPELTPGQENIRPAPPGRRPGLACGGQADREAGRSRSRIGAAGRSRSRIGAAGRPRELPWCGKLGVMTDLLARHRAVIPNCEAHYYDHPLEITCDKGCRVTDDEGRSYLDFFGGILTNMLGYDIPEVREA